MKEHPLTKLMIVILFVCCTSNKITNTDQDKDAKIGNVRYLHLPQKGEDALKTSYFADKVVYIPLETTTESLIYNINQLCINDSYVFVYCPKRGLLQFRRNGKFGVPGMLQF